MAHVRQITVVCALALCLLVGTVGAAGAVEPTRPAPNHREIERVADPVPGQYIVTLNTSDPAQVPADADAYWWAVTAVGCSTSTPSRCTASR